LPVLWFRFAKYFPVLCNLFELRPIYLKNAMNLLKQIEISSDETVIQKILDGEISIFEILIRRYNGPLYKIARSFGLNHQDAEDMMQETHLKAYLNLHSFRQEASYKTWISRIMVRNCLRHLGKSFNKNEHPSTEKIHEGMQPLYSNSQESAMNRKEMAKLLEYSLEKLPLPYKTVFVLREMEGFSVAETAALLEITTVNVKVRLNRAKAMLHKELEKLYSTSDLFEFNLIYCDEVVRNVFEKINRLNQQ
jgi:RNA polymerase sigma factor (sigma-70 family)